LSIWTARKDSTMSDRAVIITVNRHGPHDPIALGLSCALSSIVRMQTRIVSLRRMTLVSIERPPVMKKATEIKIPRSSLLRVEGDSRGTQILCRCGLCWITQEGDLKDYLPGKRAGFYSPSGRSHRGSSPNRHGDRREFRKYSVSSPTITHMIINKFD
jgi:hypothetical protein